MNTSHKLRMILIGIITAAATVFTYAQTMTVVVKNVSGNNGSVRVSIFNTADAFLKTPVATQVVPATNGQVTAAFADIQKGNYAVSVVHDANNNDELDSNFMGMPTEGFGFSNDAMGTFGPPAFAKAAFTLETSQEIIITLRYL
jgi:uncharacterized protein (DUF2141 family)